MIEPVLVVFTIVMILLMSTAAVLVLIFSKKNPSSLNKSFRNFSVLLLAYLLAAFLQYYFQYNDLGYTIVKLLGCISDICYFMFIVSWMNIIIELSGRKIKIGKKTIILITAVYGLLAEAIVIFAGSCSSQLWVIIERDIWRTVLAVLNGIYGILVLAFSIAYMCCNIIYKDSGYGRKSSVLISGALSFYMIWILISDYDMVYKAEHRILSGIIIDPLLVFCCIIDILIILFFFRKDPLEIFCLQNEIQQEKQLECFASEKSLTPREKEVLELICMGMNNPGIAERLCISDYTVKRHVNNIFQKSGVSSRYELISNVLNRKGK